MVSITLTRTDKGAGQALHIAGCGDIKKSHDAHYGKAQTFTADTLVEAIKLADQEMADWFGEDAYSQSSRDNGCWTTLSTDHAPCFVTALKANHVGFDPETGEPR